MLLSSTIPALFAETGTTVDINTIKDILNAVTNQFSISNIVAMIAGILGVTVAFVFLWWGVRKGFRAIVAASTKGRPTV